MQTGITSNAASQNMDSAMIAWFRTLRITKKLDLLQWNPCQEHG